MHAAPVVLSGSVGLAGWIKLDDTATWLAFADRLAEAGRTTDGLPPSTYEALLQINWDSGYPVGAFSPLGVTGRLAGADLAWLVQPYLAFLAALLALALAGLLTHVVDRGWWRGVAAAVSACAALLLRLRAVGRGQGAGAGRAGGACRGARADVAPRGRPLAGRRPARDRRGSRRRRHGSLRRGVAAPGAARRRRPARPPTPVAAGRRRGGRCGGLLTALAAAPTIALVRPDRIRSGAEFASGSADIGNLVGPLRFAQIAGIWPTGDFRLEPVDLGPTYLMAAVVGLAAVGGLVVAAMRRRWELVLLVAATVLPAVAFGFGNAWVAGKALAVASPAVLAAAFVAAAWLLSTRRPVEGGVLATVLVAGVAWSGVAQYHDVWLSPRGPLAELAAIGRDYLGRGPALMTEYSTFGARHFLRGLDAESASELRRRMVPLRTGGTLGKAGYADIDAFALEAVLGYPTLVLRRSATASRPPSVYRLDRVGEWYEVWVRDPGAPAILEHLPLGTPADPVGVASCPDVRRLATLAGPSGQVATVERKPNVTLDLSSLPLPPGWTVDPAVPGAVVVDGPGAVEGTVRVDTAGEYGLWLVGSFRPRTTVSVDGEEVFVGRMQLNWPGTATPVGAVVLAPGEHAVRIAVDGGDLAPGSGGPPTSLGPLVLSQSTAATPVTYVPTAQAESRICGRSVDWVEAVR